MKVKNLDPVWDETFDLPVAKSEHSNLEAAGKRFGLVGSIGITVYWRRLWALPRLRIFQLILS